MTEADHVIRVAVVDDDESLCRSVARLLRAAGIESATYLSAEDFLRDPNHTRFGCLILDIQLGGMSGLELCEQLTKVGPAIPVLFLTAHDEPEMRQRALQLGCAAFLSKTDSGASLLAAVDRLIRPEGQGAAH